MYSGSGRLFILNLRFLEKHSWSLPEIVRRPRSCSWCRRCRRCPPPQRRDHSKGPWCGATLISPVQDLSVAMKLCTPAIAWHNRERVASVDFQPRQWPEPEESGVKRVRVASGGDDHHVVVSKMSPTLLLLDFVDPGVSLWRRSGRWGRTRRARPCSGRCATSAGTRTRSTPSGGPQTGRSWPRRTQVREGCFLRCPTGD